MGEEILYSKIVPSDYQVLTRIMTLAFDEDTAIHTIMKDGGPRGYNDGQLVKQLNEQMDCQSFKIVYDNNIVGAYTIKVNQNNEYSLEILYIDPEYRKYHLGTRVWKDIEQTYPEAKRWILETPDYSTRNHYFYTRKCGYKFYEEKKYDSGAKSFIFEKLM